MIYYVYTLAPLDDWRGFVSLKDFLANPEDAQAAMDDLAWLVKMRRVAACSASWEGNPNMEAVGAIPSAEDPWPLLLYCAKQPNNGTTFVVSPEPLWHLHKGRGSVDFPKESDVNISVEYPAAELRIVEWRDEEAAISK
jgi:hypothetical protein